jgi:RNA polymerase sigma-32 factor
MTYPNNNATHKANADFISHAMKAPMLTHNEERALIAAWHDRRDESALHRLTTAHHRLAVSLAHKFRHYGLPVSDLIQEGVIGLLQAADRFDLARDVRFSTYAIWWIRSAIQDYILRNWSIVRTGTTAAQKSLFFNLRRLRAKIEGTSGTSLSMDEKRDEIAKTLGVSTKDVEAMEQRMGFGDQSLNAVISDDGQDEWIALLPDQRPNPEEIITQTRDSKTRSAWLSDALVRLPDRERAIIRSRHLTQEVVTLEDLGKSLGISKERVRQLETRAMERLKDHLIKRENFTDLIS